MWRIEISDKAEAQIMALDKSIRQRIIKFLRERVIQHPDPGALAEPLTGPLRGLSRFRVGDYRIICDIQKEILFVLVLEVEHRRDVYR